MLYLRRSVATAAALLCVSASVAPAQRPQTREGFWISLGTGLGVATFGCKGCSSFASELKGIGPTAHLRLGGTFSEKVLIGLEVNAWTKSASGVKSAAGVLTSVFWIYPRAPERFFFKIGLGPAAYRSDDGTDTYTSLGYSLIGGVGWDHRIGRTVSISPVINVTWGGIGDYRRNRVQVANAFRQAWIEFGAGLTFH